MQAIILAAGKGLRLRPFTKNHPKPLILINNCPLLEYTLDALPDNISEVVIVIGYLGEQIQNHFGNSFNNKPITYVKQIQLLGTGNALWQAKNIVHQSFLVVNGDDLYTKSDLENLITTSPSMLVWPSLQTSQYGITMDEQQNFIGFNNNSSLINCGAYSLTPDFFKLPLISIEATSGTEYSLPHTLAELTKITPVKLVQAKEWLPIGTPEQLEFANNYLIGKV